jgi:aspartyl protease family protein
MTQGADERHPPGRQSANGRLGHWMIIGAWLLLLVLLTLFFSQWLQHQANPNRELKIVSDQGGGAAVVLQRNRAGHYTAPGSINGVGVSFLLDTGATYVAVPESIAQKAALEKGPVTRSATANGVVSSWLTRIDEVRLGPIVLHEVRASILPGMSGDEVLLGMSFLKHLKLEQQGNSLKVSQP